MATTLIDYARCSSDKQDLAAQKAALGQLGDYPISDLAELFSVSRPTVYRTPHPWTPAGRHLALKKHRHLLLKITTCDDKPDRVVWIDPTLMLVAKSAMGSFPAF